MNDMNDMNAQFDEDITPRTRVQLKSLSHTHEAIAMWLFENPEQNMGECARAFGYRQGSLTQIVHSDLFQLRLANMRQQQMHTGVLQLHEQLAGVASLALDRLAEQTELEQDTDRLSNIADRALRRLGYGAPNHIVNINTGTVNTTNNVSKDLLGEARILMRTIKEITEPPIRTDDHDALEVLLISKETNIADPFRP